MNVQAFGSVQGRNLSIWWEMGLSIRYCVLVISSLMLFGSWMLSVIVLYKVWIFISSWVVVVLIMIGLFCLGLTRMKLS